MDVWQRQGWITGTLAVGFALAAPMVATAQQFPREVYELGAITSQIRH